MATETKIEWCDHTFNPWRGCSKVHAGCANCYAEREAKRFPTNRGIWGPNGTRVVAAEATWREPVKWNRQAEVEGVRKRVFCASLADVFEDFTDQLYSHDGGNAVVHRKWGEVYEYGSCPLRGGSDALHLAEVRRRLFALIDATPYLDWLLLTKRPEHVRRMWPCPLDTNGDGDCHLCSRGHFHYRPNIWLGTSVSDQATADELVPRLLECRDLASRLFLSAEPLLGPVKLTDSLRHCRCPRCGGEIIKAVPTAFTWCADCCVAEARRAGATGEGMSHDGTFPTRPMIDWVIAGGESGHKARPMHPDWARGLRDQCQAAGVPFLFKQWGEWLPMDNAGPWCEGKTDQLLWPGRPNDERTLPTTMFYVGKHAAGRELDGREWNEFPQGAEVAHA